MEASQRTRSTWRTYLCLIKIAHKFYYQEDGQWIEETTSRKLPESEVPPFIRNKGIKKETDITEEMEEALGLEV